MPKDLFRLRRAEDRRAHPPAATARTLQQIPIETSGVFAAAAATHRLAAWGRRTPMGRRKARLPAARPHGAAKSAPSRPIIASKGARIAPITPAWPIRSAQKALIQPVTAFQSHKNAMIKAHAACRPDQVAWINPHTAIQPADQPWITHRRHLIPAGITPIRRFRRISASPRRIHSLRRTLVRLARSPACSLN
ncbi:MAG: hypothetical protein FJ100_20415 [Deltaproteobacteria bacterium]|nr:hypothetical protein [Deltaproteobacteria bacterium]